MNVAEIIKLLATLAEAGRATAALIESAREHLSSTDEAALREELARLEAANTEAYQRVRAKLDAAAKDG